MSRRNFYQILGVSTDASLEEIKKSYRALALKLHPDKNPNNTEALHQFRVIQEAYEILRSKEKRTEYDRTLNLKKPQEHLKKPAGPLAEVRDLKYALALTLEEMVFGTEKTIRFMRKRDSTDEAHEMKVVVPEETWHGQKLRIKGAGDGSLGKAGDLFIHIHEKPHPMLSVHERNLKVTAPISLQTAILGGQIFVPSLRKIFELKVPAGTPSGALLRLQGKGLPRTAQFPAGDLLVQVVVEIPQQLTAEQKAYFKNLESLHLKTPLIDDYERTLQQLKSRTP